MVSLTTVRNALPPFRNKKLIITDRQGTDDIINEILKTHREFTGDYDRIYQYFDTGDIYSTANGIWSFLKYNLRYNAENDSEQSVKSPAAILHPGEKIDCKHYSLFAGGVLDAIRRNTGDTWDWFYRFVSYYPGEDVGHVFVVVTDGQSEIWIDPVLTSFNSHKKYSSKIDRSAMSLVKITGIGTTGQATATVTVDKNVAWASFLTAAQLNLFAIKDLMKQNPLVTNGALRNLCNAKGYDYYQLMRFLNA